MSGGRSRRLRGASLGALAATAVIAGGLVPAAADAQVSSDGAVAGSASPIIVTAQRRSERLEDVPITITSISADQLQQAGVTGLFDLSTLAPAVRVDHYGAYTQPTIRGIGTQDVLGPGANANVAIYVDGFYMPSQSGNIFEFANIQQVDIVKGPQGTLFGQNATGGAILITTRDPGPEPVLHASLGYGSFDDIRASIYGSTPLSDNLAADLSIHYRESDSYFDDVNTGRPTAPLQYIDVRSKWRLELGADDSITAAFTYSDVNDPTGLAENTVNPIAAFYRDTFGVPTVHTTEIYQTSLNYSVMANPKAWSASLTGRFDLGGVTLNSLTQYRDQDASIRADLDGTTVQYWQVEYDEVEETFTQELNLTSQDTGPFDWVVGLYYYYNKGTLTNNAYNDFFNTGVRTSWLSSVSTVTTNSYAAFADGTYEVTDGLFLTAGARYTSERKALQTANNLAPFQTFEGATTWNRFTPRAAVRLEVGPDTNVYASVSQGFMSGNYAYASVGPQVPADPERVTQYEVGFKTYQENFSFDLAAFYSDYTDLQVFLFDDACACFQLDNARKAEIYGAEAQVTARLSDRFSLVGGLAYTHARYREFIGVGVTNLPVIPPNYGFATTPTDFSGGQMLRAPEWTGSLTANYTQPTDIGTFGLSGTLYFTSRVPFTPLIDDSSIMTLSQPGYALVNLGARWTDPGGHFTVSVYANNVTDKEYLIFAGAGFLGLNQIAGPPASYGVRLDLRF